MTEPEPVSPPAQRPEHDPGRDVVPFGQGVWAWFAISLQTFGGPAGQIAVMQRELVEERRWIGPQRFLHALNYCMLLPGPEASSLPSMSAGSSTASAAAWPPASCSSPSSAPTSTPTHSAPGPPPCWGRC
jgi:hypothetical protein